MCYLTYQCLYCIPLPNTFEPHNLEISRSTFASYLPSCLVQQNKQYELLSTVHRPAVGRHMPVDREEKAEEDMNQNCVTDRSPHSGCLEY